MLEGTVSSTCMMLESLIRTISGHAVDMEMLERRVPGGQFEALQLYGCQNRGSSSLILLTRQLSLALELLDRSLGCEQLWGLGSCRVGMSLRHGNAISAGSAG